jgi:hypothetical protein
VVSATRAKELLLHSESLPEPPVNPEKAQTLYEQIRPYVPIAFQDHELYQKPSAQQVEEARAIKRARQGSRKKKGQKASDEGKQADV